MGKSSIGSASKRVKVYESVIEHLPIGIALFEMSGKPLLYNKKFREIHGMSADAHGPVEGLFQHGG
jgi:hypothetical protein